jgi:glycosyltransferase involved in cell wall biosynthesis
MNPTVSVVIPTRGRPVLLAEAVASALGQTVRDLEVIVVEDGSREARVVVEGRRDPRLTYIWQSAQGVSAARNAGVAAARGEWVAFLDDDDLWRPTKLEQQLQLAAQQPDVSLVHTDYIRTTTAGEYRGRPRRGDLPTSGEMLDALVRSPPGFILTSSVLVRRDCAIACGGFNPEIAVCEDYEFLLRIATLHSFGFVGEPLTIYRRHDKALTVNKVLLVRAARVAVLERFLDTLKPHMKLGRKHRAHLAHSHLYCAREALLLGAVEQVRFHTGRAVRWNPRDRNALLYALACMVGGPGLRTLEAVVRRREKAEAPEGHLPSGADAEHDNPTSLRR